VHAEGVELSLCRRGDHRFKGFRNNEWAAVGSVQHENAPAWREQWGIDVKEADLLGPVHPHIGEMSSAEPREGFAR